MLSTHNRDNFHTWCPKLVVSAHSSGSLLALYHTCAIPISQPSQWKNLLHNLTYVRYPQLPISQHVHIHMSPFLQFWQFYELRTHGIRHFFLYKPKASISTKLFLKTKSIQQVLEIRCIGQASPIHTLIYLFLKSLVQDKGSLGGCYF